MTVHGDHGVGASTASRCVASGSYVLAAGQGKGIVLFNAQTGSHLSTYNGHSASIHSLSLCSSGNFLSGGADRSLLLWDAASQRVLRRWGGHTGTVNSVAWAGDSESVALSASYDRGVRLWDVRSPEKTPMQTLLEAQDSVSEVQAMGPLIIAASVDGHVRQYDVRRGRLLTDVFPEPVVSVRYTLDRQAYLCTSLDSAVRLVDASTGALLNQ